MKEITGWLVFVLALSFSGCVAAGGSFKPLFNGENLDGWFADGGRIESWGVEDGILSCIAPGGGWLTTDSVYSDFVLTVDWRIFPGGNSGIGLRYPAGSHVSQTGMEIQILDDKAEKHQGLKPAQYTGGIYLQAPAVQGAAKPVGQWNSFTITCRGPLVVIVLNGREVLRANLNDYSVGADGLTPLAERPRSGHIGLQSHGTRVDFRNLKLKKL